jgi:hypothetical protein
MSDTERPTVTITVPREDARPPIPDEEIILEPGDGWWWAEGEDNTGETLRLVVRSSAEVLRTIAERCQ